MKVSRTVRSGGKLRDNFKELPITKATIARSKTIWGPYDSCPHNPLITATDENDPSLCGLGHADMVEDKEGKWWMVFLGYRITEQYYHHLGRETCLAPMKWVDGWPVVYDGKTPTEYMETECIPPTDIKNRAIRTCFGGNKLGLEWNYLRTFYNDYKLTEEGLVFTGNSYTLNDHATPAFIGRRQQDFECRMELVMAFNPADENEEAGIALMHRDKGHYELVLTKRNGQNVVILRRTVIDMVTEIVSEPINFNEIQLKIVSDRYDYKFYYGYQDTYVNLGTAKVKLLASEVVGGCMGTLVGMYASGNGSPCTESVKVKWFDYEVLPKKPKKPLYFAD